MDWGLVFVWGAVAIFVLLGWAAATYWGRRRERLWMATLLANAKDGRLPEASQEDARHGVITVSEDGFSLHEGAACVATVHWHAVNEIRAFKTDRFATDLICWEFSTSEHAERTVVHEEMAGFATLQKAVGSRYGIRHEDWWRKVALPPFAANPTVLWTRNG